MTSLDSCVGQIRLSVNIVNLIIKESLQSLFLAMFLG